MALLEIENLSVEFATASGVLRAVENLTLSLRTGDILGMVGESGSGKSVSMLAVMGLIPYPGRVAAGRIIFDGHDILALSSRERRQILGKDLAMVFQDPATSLDPCFTVGFQLTETLRAHEGLDRRHATRRAIELLEQVGIPDAESRLGSFPHQLSGGMNQRVMIAIAIACNPKLLIADEPTTALDVTIQAQILDLLLWLQRERGMALILVTHNMGVVAEIAHRVAVMYAGEIMEEAHVTALFTTPQHPYTAALLAARPEHSHGGRFATIPGTVPGLHDRPAGCLFGPRCSFATPRTCSIRPELRDFLDARVRCHYPLGDTTRDRRIAQDRQTAVERPS